MTCIAPPEPTDLELIRYLDKDADAMIDSHLIQCPHCRERATHLAAEQNRLRRALFRASCPDSDTLRDYHFGFLSGTETGAVQEHLHRCPHCTHDFAMLNDFLADLAWEEAHGDETAGPLQRIRWLMAELAGGLAPAPIGLRGEEDGRTLSYEAGDLRLDLSMLVDPKLPERRVVIGSLLGQALDEGAWTADLWSGAKWAGTQAVDDFGSFRFGDLPPGRYEIIVNGPDSKIRIPEFDVR